MKGDGSMKDLKQISQSANIPVELLKDAIKIPSVCSATTVEEAKHQYYAARNDRDKEAALIRWEELSLSELLAANSLDDIKTVYHSCPKDSLVEFTAIQKWFSVAKNQEELLDIFNRSFNHKDFQHVVFSELLSLSKTIESVTGLCQNLANEFEAEAWAKWDKLSLREVAVAHSLDKIKAATTKSRWGSQSHIAAVTKWLSLCRTTDQTKEAYKYCPDNSSIEDSTFRKLEAIALKESNAAKTLDQALVALSHLPNWSDALFEIQDKCKQLSLKEVAVAKTLAEAQKAYARAQGLQSANEAFDNYLSFCDSIELLTEAYDFVSKTPYGHMRGDETSVMLKWKEYSLKEISSAQNLDEAKKAFNRAPAILKIKEALEKWLSFCNTIDQAKEVFEQCPKDSEIQKTAVRLIYTLF